MKPYMGVVDITLKAWNGLYHWCGVWHAVRDSEGKPIRFRSWRDAKEAARMEHAKTRPFEPYAGSFNTVAELKRRLTKAGFVCDLHGDWRRGDRTLRVQGSAVNGFYVAATL